MKFVFSPLYSSDVGGHPWQTQKYAAVRDLALAQGVVSAADVIEPGEADDADVALVHPREWIDRVRSGGVPWAEWQSTELPYTPEVVRHFLVSCQGTVLACRAALEEGRAYHAGGGFHHAFRERGTGFCLFNDIAVGILKMRAEGRARRVAVVDLDVHQGDGTARIFRDDPDVFTFSMHQENNFPWPKQQSSLDVGLRDATGDDAYLALLREHLPKVLDAHRPELVFYVAGADPYVHDSLGGLALTIAGLAERDRVVAAEARTRRVPVVAALAGGYAEDPRDTATIHFNTLKALAGC